MRSGREVVVEAGMLRELLREDPRVLLRAHRVLAGFEIADAGERQQRLHHQTPRGRVLLRRLVRPPPFDQQTRGGHRRQRSGEAHSGVERREERAVGREHPVGRSPQRRAAPDRGQQSPHQAEAQEEECG